MSENVHVVMFGVGRIRSDLEEWQMESTNDGGQGNDTTRIRRHALTCDLVLWIVCAYSMESILRDVALMWCSSVPYLICSMLEEWEL